jgi:phage gpG-like protein
MATHGTKELNAKLEKLARALQTIAPKRIAANAERHYKESFANQGFTDRTLQLWPKTKNGKAKRILKRTGNLYNSIRIVRADANGIQITAGGPHVPYARIHNLGGTIEGEVSVRTHLRKAHSMRTRRGRVIAKAAMVQAHQRKLLIYMAKRQFMGKSHVLDLKFRDTLTTTIAQALR